MLRDNSSGDRFQDRFLGDQIEKETPNFESCLKDMFFSESFVNLEKQLKNLYKELPTSEQVLLIVFIYLNVNDANVKIKILLVNHSKRGSFSKRERINL